MVFRITAGTARKQRVKQGGMETRIFVIEHGYSGPITLFLTNFFTKRKYPTIGHYNWNATLFKNFNEPK